MQKITFPPEMNLKFDNFFPKVTLGRVCTLNRFEKKSSYIDKLDDDKSLSLQRITQETTPMMVIRAIMINEEEAMKRVSRMSSEMEHFVSFDAFIVIVIAKKSS